MKYKFFVMCFLSVIILSVLLEAEVRPVKWIPEKPEAGNEILIKFNPSGTELETAGNVTAVVYSVVLDTIYCDEYSMAKTSEGWECKYDIPEQAWSVGVRFSDGDNVVDDSGVNFPLFLYNAEGNILKGTRASYASLCFSTTANTKAGAGKACLMFEEEFEDNPGLTKYFLSKYILSLSKEKPEGWKETIKNTVASINTDGEDLDERALAELEYTFNYIVKDKAKAAEYNSIAVRKYPLGQAAQTEAYNKIKQLSDSNVEELENAILAFREKFGGNTMYSTSMWRKLIDAYCENKMYLELKEFLVRNHGVLNELSSMNSISAQGKNIAESDGDLGVAKYLVDYSYEILEKYEPSREAFRGDTQAQRKYKIDGYKSRTLYDAASVYERAGEPQEAFKFIEKAYGYNDPNDAVKVLYAKLLVELHKNADEALTITADLIKDSKVTSEITDLNREAYIQINNSDQGYNEYFGKLRKPLLDEYKEEVEKGLINKPAQDFSLTDIDGNTITLSELKGKVVILDFWASWCMPCKASMPLMKDAVEKYADDEDVEFFFIDSFERGELADIKEQAKKFMEENNYPFHVLFDADGKVAKDGYGVTMIPAKVFIDKDGNERFLSMGFDKSKLLDEIDIIIDLLK